MNNYYTKYLKYKNKYIELKNDIEDENKITISIEQIENKTVEGKILDDMGLNKYCCIRMMLAHVDLCDKV